jgi:hypothetical protein
MDAGSGTAMGGSIGVITTEPLPLFTAASSTESAFRSVLPSKEPPPPPKPPAPGPKPAPRAKVG